jgi:RNA polymerase sigma factor (sigma-70 family)
VPRDDTDIGGPIDRFPATRHSAIAGARSDDPGERRRSVEALVAVYWKPVYKHVRLRWRKDNEEAKDLTQAFFARVLEKDWLRPYDPARARFRTFLRTCLDGFLAHEAEARARRKRGGGALAVDFEAAERELIAESPDPDEAFDREWARALIEGAVAELRERCAQTGRSEHFRVFERYDLSDEEPRPSYPRLAAELSLPVTTITNRLAQMRRELRALVVEALRAITGGEEELHAETLALFGGRAP